MAQVHQRPEDGRPRDAGKDTAANGAVRDGNHPTPEVCSSCRGTGRDPMSDITNWLPCWTCHGTGKR
jgi:hypothetical protein